MADVIPVRPDNIDTVLADLPRLARLALGFAARLRRGTLDITLLTLLVINGYAAAMVGRLRSLPLTFAGGIALGLAEAYVVGELPADLVTRLKPALPTIVTTGVRASRIATSRRAMSASTRNIAIPRTRRRSLSPTRPDG